MEVKDGSFTVDEAGHQRPLDGVVKQRLDVPWSAARKLVETGKVSVNGARVTRGLALVRKGDVVAIAMAAPRVSTELRLDRSVIVHLDAQLVVVAKPAGISTVPFENGERGTLDQLVRALLTRIEQASAHGKGRVQGTLGVVQRLDKDTSGLLVFARTLAAKTNLAQQLRVHTVHRRYLAVAHGHVTAQTFRSSLVADRGDGLRGSTRLAGQGQMAITHVEVVETFADATLITCRLETGRTHQIRVHLAESGHPLVGEAVYIRDFKGPRLPAPRILLHARELGFEHPSTGEHLRFSLDPPPDFETAVAALRGRK